MKRVCCYLGGGFGNQCFNYATARAMALDGGGGVFLHLDSYFYSNHGLDGFGRMFALDDYCCKYEILPMHSHLMNRVHRYYHNRIKRLGWRRFFNTVVDTNCFMYSPLPKKWIGDISISGPWQSEKYFIRHADTIAKDFALRNAEWLARDLLAKEIKENEKSVFLHVRSYKDIKGHEDGSAALPLPYYENALAKLAELMGAGTVYCFSDDREWAIERVRPLVVEKGFSFVPVMHQEGLLDPNRYSSSFLRDFTLMRLCRHGIVADSSFSWWAGWLGERREIAEGHVPIRLRPANRNAGTDFWPERWTPIAF